MNRNLKTGLIVAGVVAAVFLSVALIFGFGRQNVGWGMMGGLGFGGMGFFMVLFWGLLIWGFVSLVRGGSSSNTPQSHTDSAMEVLKKRYARGEISRQEYEDIKRDLS